jgi:hypothetical protein
MPVTSTLSPAGADDAGEAAGFGEGDAAAVTAADALGAGCDFFEPPPQAASDAADSSAMSVAVSLALRIGAA